MNEGEVQKKEICRGMIQKGEQSGRKKGRVDKKRREHKTGKMEISMIREGRISRGERMEEKFKARMRE